MNVLWLLAHPEPRSLTGALARDGVRTLEEAGHTVEVSDLYAMSWKPAVDRDDFSPADDCIPEERLVVARTSKHAYQSGRLSEDIRAEQAKLDRADTVVFHFPLWWYGMPAILKGWVDRVFVKGYAYGVPDPQHPDRSLRYGEGTLAGKRALVIVAAGSPEAALGPRGINGQLDQVLFPLLHGTLWYVGMSVLPPMAVYGADRLSDEEYADAADRLRQRLLTIEETAPIRYRYQNDGDYDDDLVLRPGLAPDGTGLGVHIDET